MASLVKRIANRGTGVNAAGARRRESNKIKNRSAIRNFYRRKSQGGAGG